MRKDAIEQTKQKAINLLESNVSNQSNNGFGTLMAEAIGVQPCVISFFKDGTRKMTLEKALEIIQAYPKVMRAIKFAEDKKKTK